MSYKTLEVSVDAFGGHTSEGRDLFIVTAIKHPHYGELVTSVDNDNINPFVTAGGRHLNLTRESIAHTEVTMTVVDTDPQVGDIISCFFAGETRYALVCRTDNDNSDEELRVILTDGGRDKTDAAEEDYWWVAKATAKVVISKRYIDSKS